MHQFSLLLKKLIEKLNKLSILDEAVKQDDFRERIDNFKKDDEIFYLAENIRNRPRCIQLLPRKLLPDHTRRYRLRNYLKLACCKERYKGIIHTIDNMKKIVILILLGIGFVFVLLNAKDIVRLIRKISDKNPSQQAQQIQKNSVVTGDCATNNISSKLDISYGPSELDIYYPTGSDCENLPVMMYVHGGAYQDGGGGDKSQNVQDKITYFTSQGFVFISVNYRRVPDVTYPVFNEDVAHAVAWVSENISQYGGNPKKISLIGHSSGGTIVSSIAVDESYLENLDITRTNVRCAISLDAAYDLSDKELAFDTNPEILKNASPMTHIESGKYIPPFFLVTRGTARRVGLVTEFSNKLKEVGIHSEILVTQDLDHAGVNKAIGKSTDTLITPSLTTFLSRCR